MRLQPYAWKSHAQIGESDSTPIVSNSCKKDQTLAGINDSTKKILQK